MPDTMQRIDDYTFFKCLNLEKVFVGKKSALQYIGTRAFARTAISDFYLPDGVTVCSGAFRDTNIKKIEVPQKCTYYNISGTKDSPLNSFGKGVKITERAVEQTIVKQSGICA